MSTPVERPWIDAGYAAFALGGPDALKVEQLARQVGISKSSFYHHFADVPVFIERLQEHHLQRSILLAEQAARCTTFDPDYLQLLVTNRLDILFQRQLRLRRADAAFQRCFEVHPPFPPLLADLRRADAAFQRCFRTAHDRVVAPIMPLWAKALGIPGQLLAAREMFDLVADVFYQRLTNDNLNYTGLVELLKEIETFIRHAMRSQGSISGLGTGQS